MGSRFGEDGETRVEQTSAAYIQAIAKQVSETNRELGESLSEALQTNNVRSFKVQQSAAQTGNVQELAMTQPLLESP